MMNQANPGAVQRPVRGRLCVPMALDGFRAVQAPPRSQSLLLAVGFDAGEGISGDAAGGAGDGSGRQPADGRPGDTGPPSSSSRGTHGP